MVNLIIIIIINIAASSNEGVKLGCGTAGLKLLAILSLCSKFGVDTEKCGFIIAHLVVNS